MSTNAKFDFSSPHHPAPPGPPAQSPADAEAPQRGRGRFVRPRQKPIIAATFSPAAPVSAVVCDATAPVMTVTLAPGEPAKNRTRRKVMPLPAKLPPAPEAPKVAPTPPSSAPVATTKDDSVLARKRDTTSLTPAASAAHAKPNWSIGGPALNLTYVEIDTIKQRDRKLKKHTSKSVAQIEASIRQFGFTQPILIDAKGVIVAGAGRYMAAHNIGMKMVPVVRIEHLSDAEIRALVIADNKLAEQSGWDEEALKLELGELLSMNLDYDLEVTGLSTVEIDNIMLGDARTADPADEVVEAPARPVTRLGDLWLLGVNKLICGDSLKTATYVDLLGEERARLVISDNPYNLPTKSYQGMGKVKHEDFAMATGEMTREQFTSFLTTVFDCCTQYSIDGAIHFQFIDHRHLIEMMTAGEAVYSEMKQLCVWSKNNSGLGSFYRSQHELVFVWKVGTAPHTNTFGLGGTGRHRSNIWSYEGVNTFRKGRMDDLTAHPTVKPIALVADAIRDVSKRGEIVLDPFMGSGTTILAAERTGRVARGIEIEPKFVDVTIRRWEKMTGKEAILASTGQTFAEVEAERSTMIDEEAD